MKCGAIFLLVLGVAIVASTPLKSKNSEVPVVKEEKAKELVGDSPEIVKHHPFSDEDFGDFEMDLPQTEGMDIDEEIRARRIKFLTACSQTAMDSE